MQELQMRSTVIHNYIPVFYDLNQMKDVLTDFPKTYYTFKMLMLCKF